MTAGYVALALVCLYAVAGDWPMVRWPLLGRWGLSTVLYRHSRYGSTLGVNFRYGEGDFGNVFGVWIDLHLIVLCLRVGWTRPGR